MAAWPRSLACRRTFWAATLAALPGVAWALMPPQVYRDGRMRAAHHVQVRVTDVTPPAHGQLGECAVRGRVVRVFKGDLTRGTPLALTLWCKGPARGEAAIAQMPFVGGRLDTPTQTLQAARYLEVFLGGTPPNIIHDQAKIIAKPSRRPVCDPGAATIRC